MLFEKTVYLDNFPINIKIVKVTEYPFHYHRDVEFIYVLKGKVHLKNVCHHYILKEGDVFTNSGHEVHCITADEKENVIAIIQISNRFFTQYFPTLGRACYMSYVRNDKYLKTDPLRKMLLQILLDYFRRSFNYKSTCIEQMIEIVKYMNDNFNLFAFDGDVVVNFNNDNAVVVERISRIITYVYENHASKITLDDIAEREHLSTYYVSHLVREYMGISFQELVCFARAEMSEIPLLETDRKISVIAKDVGFSTTAYYEKFFKKWFGHTPQEYRDMYTSHILSASRPEIIEELSDSEAINLIRRCMSAVQDQEKSESVIDRLHLSVQVDPSSNPVMEVKPRVEIVITQEDYHIMGERLFNALFELNASKVILALKSGDNEATTSLMENRLNFIGYEVEKVTDNGLSTGSSAGYDSIVSGIELFRKYFFDKDNLLHLRLRDQGDLARILKGTQGCMTSCLIPKQSYYAYRFLKNIKGELICWGKYYYVIRNYADGKEAYTLIAINFNDEILKLYARNDSVYEANDVLNSFKDELNIDFTIPVEPGRYFIANYGMFNGNSIFSYMSQLGFPKEFPITEGWLHMLNTEPQSQTSVKTVEDKLNISAHIKGAGIRIYYIERAENQS